MAAGLIFKSAGPATGQSIKDSGTVILIRLQRG